MRLHFHWTGYQAGPAGCQADRRYSPCRLLLKVNSPGSLAAAVANRAARARTHGERKTLW